jgi:carboxymethylenebutenolidase
MGKMMSFTRPDGGSSRGYLAEAGPARPGLIVIQEWWGLNEHICSIADRFAAAGFTALAPDLYRGRLASSRDEARHMMDGLDFPDATYQDIRGGVQLLARQCSKVGVTGFCMGGALTIAAAVHLSEISAAVCFYGIPPKEFADPAKIRIPFQAHFANQDDWCTPKLVEVIEAEMLAAGVPAQVFRYAAAHAFFNATRPEVYDADSAKIAWERTIAFFGRHLVG